MVVYSFETLSGFSREKFIEVFSTVFEGNGDVICGKVYDKLASSSGGKKKLQLTTISDFVDAFWHVMEYDLDENSKFSLLTSHPKLAIDKLKGALSKESENEHQKSGISHLSKEDLQKFISLNEEYSAKFGFPFIVCVREQRGKDGILRTFERRLHHDKKEELDSALDEVKKIARIRILDMIGIESVESSL